MPDFVAYAIFYGALLIAASLLLFVGHVHGRFQQATEDRREIRAMELRMGDTSKLATSLQALSDSIDKLVAAVGQVGASDQAAIDAAQAQADALKAKVDGAIPA